jgi:hypothetical protein
MHCGRKCGWRTLRSCKDPHTHSTIIILVIKVKKGEAIPVTRSWGSIYLWNVEAPTFSRRSAHRWRWGQPYAPGTLFCYKLSRPLVHSAVARIRSIEKSNYIIGNRIRGLPACSILPKPTTLRVPHYLSGFEQIHCAFCWERTTLKTPSTV